MSKGKLPKLPFAVFRADFHFLFPTLDNIFLWMNHQLSILLTIKGKYFSLVKVASQSLAPSVFKENHLFVFVRKIERGIFTTESIFPNAMFSQNSMTQSKDGMFLCFQLRWLTLWVRKIRILMNIFLRRYVTNFCRELEKNSNATNYIWIFNDSLLAIMLWFYRV